jgi:hypothetical protein
MADKVSNEAPDAEATNAAANKTDQGGAQAKPVALDPQQTLDKIVLYALDEGRQKLEENGSFEPFTVILRDEDLLVENHVGDDVLECFESAARTVQALASSSQAYVFVYDGYINSVEGRLDAMIAERGVVGQNQADAFALLYSLDSTRPDGLTIGESILGLGQTTSLLEPDSLRHAQLEED